MKNYSRYLLTLLVAVAFALALKVPAQANVTVPNFRQSTCTANTITVTWGNPIVTDGETVTSFDVMTPNESVSVKVGAGARSATINVPANYVGNLYFYANYNSKYGGSNRYFDYTSCNTVPAAPKKDNAGLYSIQESAGTLTFGASRYDYNHGTQIELYKGNKLVKNLYFTSYSDNIKIAKGAAYQYRCRFYCKNNVNGQTSFSGWGPWNGFIWSKQAKYKTRSNQKGYTLIMKKASGIKKYVIKYATSSTATKFKKVKSFKAKNKKSYSIRVTKNYKKRATNYVRIYPYISLKWFKGYSQIFIKCYPYPYK